MSENLQTIRGIDWRLWDPLGLSGRTGQPDGAIDEYDSYLLDAVAMREAGQSLQDVIATLMDVESEDMGLGELPDAEERATQTVLELHAVILSP